MISAAKYMSRPSDAFPGRRGDGPEWRVQLPPMDDVVRFIPTGVGLVDDAFFFFDGTCSLRIVRGKILREGVKSADNHGHVC